WGMGVLVRAAARHADALISGTAAARDQVSAVLRLDPGRFTVVHHGYRHTRGARRMPADEVRARHQLAAHRVVLCLAAKRPHKNQELLVRCVEHLEPDIVIVLAGHAEPYELRLREIARSLGVESRIRFVGYLPDAE